jgi:hypothetical protein
VTTVSPLPQYVWTTPNGTITAGQNSNNVDVTWGTGAGNVTVRAYNTCGASSTRTQSFATAGCREESFDFAQGDGVNFIVYPNPAHDKATVSIYVKENAVFNITLTDISGRTTWSENRVGNEGVNTYDIDLTRFSKGIYMLEVKSAGDSRKTKVVIG